MPYHNKATSASGATQSATPNQAQPPNFGEADPIALNFTLLPDVCGVPGATVHSYRVLQSATCANGTTATFSYYDSKNCTADPTDEDPNPGMVKKMRAKSRRDGEANFVGECLALVAFNSLAFVCEGVAPRNDKFISLSTSTIAPTSTFSPVTSSVSFTFLSTSSSNRSATATSSSATSSPSKSNHGSKSGLSAGTSAGVGVGSAIGVLTVAVVLFFCFHRQTLANTKLVNGRSEQWSGNAAMRSAFATGGIAYGPDPPPYEAGIGQPHEILGDAIDNVHEVGTDNEIHEVANERTNLGS